jgi:hypothetical protein
VAEEAAASRRKLELYEEAFRKIKEATGVRYAHPAVVGILFGLTLVPLCCCGAVKSSLVSRSLHVSWHVPLRVLCTCHCVCCARAIACVVSSWVAAVQHHRCPLALAAPYAAAT